MRAAGGCAAGAARRCMRAHAWRSAALAPRPLPRRLPRTCTACEALYAAALAHDSRGSARLSADRNI